MTSAEAHLRDAASEAGAALADEAGAAAERLKGAARGGGDAAGTAKSAALDIRSAAVEQGRQLYEVARSEATSFADQRKNDAAASVAGIATSLRDTSRGFEDRPNIRAFVESAADGLDQLAGGIRERSFADIYAEFEAYARRSPATVGAVAVAAGFLLARFIKSTSEELSETAAERSRTSGHTAAARRTRVPAPEA